MKWFNRSIIGIVLALCISTFASAAALNDYGTPAVPGPNAEFIYMTEATGGVAKNASVAQIGESLALAGFGVIVPQVYGRTDTVYIPEDFATMQEAFDALSHNQPSQVIMNIQTGHALASGLSLPEGDWHGWSITCEDAAVPLADGFAGNILSCTNCTMPSLNCLIDAVEQVSGNGVYLSGASMFIAPGAGIINAWGTGLSANDGSLAVGPGSLWTGAARNATTGAGITIWSSFGSFEGASVANSNYYGAQAAHGGVLGFRGGIATDCYRYGVRATDAGFINFSDGDASRAGEIGVYAFNASIINARPVTATGCGTHNVAATHGSTLNVTDSDLSGSLGNGIYASTGSTISAVDVNVSGAAGDYGIYAGSGATVSAGGTDARKGAGDSTSDFVTDTGGKITLNTLSVGGTSVQPNITFQTGTISDPRAWTPTVTDITANQPNFGISATVRKLWYLNPTAARNIYGMSATVANGERLLIVNVSATETLTIFHDSASATAPENRIITPGGVDIVMGPGSSLAIFRANDRWHTERP